jgi:Ca-activated chloride channel family protein
VPGEPHAPRAIGSGGGDGGASGRHGVSRHRRRYRRRRRRIGLGLVSVLLLLVIGVGAALAMRFGDERPAAPDCPPEHVEVFVTTAPKIAPIVTDLAAAYEARQERVGGRCISVTVRTEDSSAVASGIDPVSEIAADALRPTVWIPESSTWINILLARPDAAVVLPKDRPAIATSPLVLAMPEPMAKAMGWPGRQLAWIDVVGLMRDPSGWKKAGHPEWGQFRVGMADPTRSADGLNALLGIYRGLSGSVSNADDLRFGLLACQRALATRPADAAALTERLRGLTGPEMLGQVSAFPMSEQDVIAFNRGDPAVPLVAVYPRDGALPFDPTYLLLQAPWVEPAQDDAARGFLGFLLSSTGQQEFTDQGWRGGGGPKVTASTGIVPDEPKAPAPDLDAETTVSVLQGWVALDRRGNVLALMDVSGSMATPVPGTGLTKLELAARAAAFAVPFFNDQTRVGLWVFSTKLDGARDYRVVVPLGSVGGRVNGVVRRDLLATRLGRIAASGGTGLYDTVLAAVRQMRDQWQPDGVNTVVLLTDGRNEDPNSLSLARLLRTLRQEANRQRPVQLFAIAYGDDADVGVLRQITAAVGGQVFVSRDPTDIKKVYLAALTR